MFIYNIISAAVHSDLNDLNCPTYIENDCHPNISVSVFPLHCPVLLQATPVPWERGGISVELQPVSTGCLKAAVFCDLASTAVISHRV